MIFVEIILKNYSCMFACMLLCVSIYHAGMDCYTSVRSVCV